MCPPFRQFPIVFHNSSIFLPYWLATLVSFRETFQEEKLLTMKGSYKSRWVIVIVVVIAAIAAFWFWQAAMTPGVQPRGDETSAAIASGWSPWYAFRPISPGSGGDHRRQAVPRYLTGLGTITAANTVTVRPPRGRPTDSVTFPGRPAGQSRRFTGRK